jgi:hypothetical protein
MKPLDQTPCHRGSRRTGSWRSLPGVCLAAGLFAATTLAVSAQVAGGSSAAEIQRITDRYALTRSRISALLDQRLQPKALPATPPNPFYQPPTEVLNEQSNPTPDPGEFVPEAADISDIDTLRKYAGLLKVSGVITRNDVLHLTINNTTCTVGDIITVGTRDQPIYLKLLSLTPNEFTLGLNEAKLTVAIKK